MQGGLRFSGIEKHSEDKHPLVSIITVVYNGAKHIEQTINSVLEQSHKNIEYIIIDGGSKDGTVDIIKRYETKIDYWHSEPDDGLYFAMNKGLSLTKGVLIGILNADDFYMPNTVQKVIDTDKIQHADIYYGDIQYLAENGSVLSSAKPDISKMNELQSIFHPACFVKNLVYHKVGTFNTQYKIAADYDFLLRCLEQQISFYYTPKILTGFRQGGMSNSCHCDVEVYKIMKIHQTGNHQKMIFRALKCYLKTFAKKLIAKKK